MSNNVENINTQIEITYLFSTPDDFKDKIIPIGAKNIRNGSNETPHTLIIFSKPVEKISE